MSQNRRTRVRQTSSETAEESSGPSRTKRRLTRGLTCLNCRSRKTRCDGSQPGCKTCEVYQDICRYDIVPTSAQFRDLTKRLEEAEQTIQHMRRANESIPPRPGSVLDTSTAPLPETRSFDGISEFPNPITSAAEGGDDRWALGAENSSIGNVFEHGAYGMEIQDPTVEEEDSATMPELSVDINGQVSYYGPTSNVHEAPSRSPHLPVTTVSRSDIRNLLSRRAHESRTWEKFGLTNAALRSDVPRQTLEKLLDLHWTWIAPLFMWVYRPAFMRDMSTGNQYYSQFLLTVMCAHTARFSDDNNIGEMLAVRAKLLLAEEIEKPTLIPTVQGLLQLSARELAYGRISQSWLYSGMAFRMTTELGLHHTASTLSSIGKLGPEDLEIRRRLFWSCYFWDKAISLYLGRSPVLLELPSNSIPEIMDDSLEDELWPPVHVTVVSTGQPYPGVNSHAVSCFINSCKLAVIMNSVIQKLYSRKGGAVGDGSSLSETSERLKEWRRASPPHLVVDTNNLPLLCPPPHIITQNLLYHTTTLLLHRPFLPSPVHRSACRRIATEVEKLLLLHETTFGFHRVTYLMAYCIYTSASVSLADVKTGDKDASKRMQTFLRALQGGLATCPVLQRSLDIIGNGLKPDFSTTIPPTRAASPSNNTIDIDQLLRNVVSGELPAASQTYNINSTAPQVQGTTDLLPAFLFPRSPMTNAVAWHNGFEVPEQMDFLECFPEARLSGHTDDWFSA